MLTNDFLGEKVSRLGFGTMRLPLNADKTVDEKATARMTEYALSHGVNYIDTAYPYHGGTSELVMGKILSGYARSSFLLADKYPGHQWASSYDPAAIYEEQLEKCRVDYFDFYLLHNVCEDSFGVYADKRWKIVDYFAEQKRKGRIRHLGMSTHSRYEHLGTLLDAFPEATDFVQIQLNYLDWTVQQGKEKYELLSGRGVPVITMESVRGGKLASLTAEQEARLRALRPEESNAGWALRFLQGLKGCRVILSGMSSEEQMRANVALFEEEKPLTEEERAVLFSIAAELSLNSVPCTACRYCTEGCPQGIDIPALMETYNNIKVGAGFTANMYLESLEEGKRPQDCLKCGACKRICPQKIDIPAVMEEILRLAPSEPDWRRICEEREEAAMRIRAQKAGK